MLPPAAADQYEQQKAIAAVTSGTVDLLWRRMGDDFDSSWARISDDILHVVDTGRRAAVTTALPYTSAVLAQTGQVAEAVADVDPAGILATTSDGRQLATLYDQSIVHAKAAVGRGTPVEEALAQSGRWLTMVTLTTLADTRRDVYAADITARPSLGGYVRMLNPPSCKDCIALAGKWFRWNTGFERHPNCDCIHVPAHEDVAGDLRTDPYKLFFSMSEAEQDATFGRIEARAIRDGGDLYRVVNLSNRGLGTPRAAARYGTPSRMTIDQIYRVAGTRTNAIKLMKREGYITGPQVRGGNLIGTGPAAAGFGQLGRGGTRRAASNAILDANATGIRDPLNRYTMTAAERALYDAHYRLDFARRTGRIPRSIGNNSADIYANPIIATPEKIAELEKALAVQVAVLNMASTPESVRRVARALGLL